MDKEQLFRADAANAKRTQFLGEIVLIRPLSFTVICAVCALMGCIVIAFFMFASYTKRSQVIGQLVPTSGQVKVYVPQPGVLLEKFVSEGQRVTRGEVLFSLSSERYDTDDKPVQAGISAQLVARRDALKDEMAKIPIIQMGERKSLASKVVSLENELSVLSRQLISQRKLVSLASNGTDRYQGLMDKGYISMDQLQQRQAELLGQQQVLQRLDRERTSLVQQLDERRNELVGLESRHGNQLSAMRRQISGGIQDLAESEAKRTLRVTAPESGIATAVFAEVGQTVDGSRQLMSIVPEGVPLQAELYAPSKAIGFISVNDPVRVRYQAYPYQKFGQYHGQVELISRTTLRASELAGITGSVPGLDDDGEQYYRLRVRLDDQHVTAYGHPQPLHSGMLLDADVLLDSRKLYEWVLEPLYSLTGKL